MPRVLLVDLERAWRGGQSQALLLLEGLRSRGHDAQLVSVEDAALAARAQAAGIPIYSAPRSWRRLGAARILLRLLRQPQFDLIHANEPHALTAAWLSGAHRRVPVVASRRVAHPIGNGTVARSRYRAARQILAVSEFVARSVADSGIPREKIRVVYDGVKMPDSVSADARERAREGWGVSNDVPLIGCVGYLLLEKGQEFLLRALPLVREQFAHARLLLVGDGPMRQPWERLASELGVREAVHFAGHVQDVEAAYSALDVFVFPSVAEPLGSSLLSAMATGLPVVAVASGAVPEIIETDTNGLLVSRPNPDEIAAAVIRLLTKPELARHLGSNARQTVCEKFSSARMIQNTLAAYEVLSRPRL